VLRNACLMRLRGDHHERRLQQAQVPALAPGPEDILEEHALCDWVWAALDALSPDDRLTVMLRYFSRCRSYHAIAAVTGVPVGTVRAKIVGVWASSDLTILEIDFINPAWAADHCPPRSTFVHHLTDGRSKRLDIHYV
jgi:Sigma-70, region 4